MTDPRGLPPSARPDQSFSPRAMAAVVVGVTLLAGILVGIGLDRAFFRPSRMGPRHPAISAVGLTQTARDSACARSSRGSCT